MREKREMYKMFRCIVSIKILLTYEVISFYLEKRKGPRYLTKVTSFGVVYFPGN